MDDQKTGKLIPLRQAAKTVPSTRPGKTAHVGTLNRWVHKGVGGEKLEAWMVGGRWMTTEEALDRFSAALTAKRLAGNGAADPSDGPLAGPDDARAEASRAARQAKIARQLTEMGV